MNVMNALYDITDFFVYCWAFLDAIVLVPDTNITFAKVIVVVAVLCALGAILFKAIGGSASGGVGSLIRGVSKGGGNSDT